MNQQLKPSAIAAKIKKWLTTAQELRNSRYALPITRLTSIKSLCQDQKAAGTFALHICLSTEQEMNEIKRPEHFSESEWDAHKKLFADAIAQMENYLANPEIENKQSLKGLLKQIDQYQGDDVRRVHWTTVHFVRSGYLLKLSYGLQCFVEPDFPYFAYKLANEYTERYNPFYGNGLIPESIPMLLDVAEFWCQYYFSQTLEEKFPVVLKPEIFIRGGN